MDFPELLPEFKSFGAGAPPVAPPPAPAAVVADAVAAEKAGMLAKAAGKVNGLKSLLGKVGTAKVLGPAAGVLVAGTGALNADRKGEADLGDFNTMAGGTAMVAPGGWGLGAGMVAGQALASEKDLGKANLASQIFGETPYLRKLFPQAFATNEGTQMMPESTPTSLSAPYLAKLLAERGQGIKPVTVEQIAANQGAPVAGSIPSAAPAAAPAAPAEVALPPVDMRRPQRGTGYITNNQTGETTVIDARKQMGIGAGANKPDPEMAALMRFGPLAAAFNNPIEFGKMLDAKSERSKAIAAGHLASGQAALMKSQTDRTAQDSEVKLVPNSTNPLQQDLMLVNKRDGTVKKLVPPKVRPTFTNADLEMAAAKFVPVGAPITHNARVQAIAALREAGYDTTGYE